MPTWYDPSLVAAANYFAITAAVVAVALISAERYLPRSSARLTLIVAALLAAGSIVSAALSSWTFAVPAGLLSGAALLAWAVRTNAFQAVLQVAARPLPVACTLILLSLSAAAYVKFAAAPHGDEVGPPMIVGSSFHAVDGLVALTDLGQPLPLIGYDDSPQQLADSERALLGTEQYAHQIIRLAEPSPACNCHGWVYTSGRFAIQGRYIPGLLDDNGYVEVNEPQPGDLVIYGMADGTIDHTGLVRMVGNDGLVLVESKWGPLGVYLHPVKAQPYGAEYKYFHSRRSGHVVAVVPSTSVPEARLPALASMTAEGIDQLEPTLTARRGKRGQIPIYERPTLRVPGQRRS
ncbi:MAG: hypothetical protein L0211_08320 [Planctomycetaceae bacterium]|nr:hypothetical protein [Planctomycetaceae bacterium]